MADIQVEINEETAEVTGSAFTIDNQIPASLAASGLAVDEFVDLQQDVNGNWVDVWENGTQIRLSSTGNILQVVPCGVYRVYKAITAGAVSVTRTDRTTAN